MRLLVITSCTGEKAVEDPRQLTLADFRKGPAHVARREKELKTLLRQASEMYTGQQHVRLMRGIQALPAEHSVDLHILSAGYGLIPGMKKIAPYETTFAGMKTKELRTWADELDAPAAFRRALEEPFDLALVLLGDSYLEAVRLDDPALPLAPAGPVVLFCGGRQAKALPRLPSVRTVPLTNAEAKRFGCGLVGLKGELALRLLGCLGVDPSLLHVITDRATDLLALLDGATAEDARPVRASARPNPNVDFVIKIPKSWWDKPHRQKLRYFIPEWDDLVDPDYDFENDVHSGGGGDWSNEVYAHQIYPEPNYDGLLISKVVAEKSAKKKARINALGVHRFLRVPPAFPVMGDCGAFGYIHEKEPPYKTADILDYYSRLGFDYGVSIDHLIVTATESEKKFRYDLTIHNAEEFLTEHRRQGLPWTPIGAVQGWDPRSYAEAARRCVSMGYQYIGLGGLVRSSTGEILRVLREVHRAIDDRAAIHLFGLARLKALREFSELGVRSVDSASFLRQAWMRDAQGYLTPTDSFAALRVPAIGRSYRAKRMLSESEISPIEAASLEREALRQIRALGRSGTTADECLNAVLRYDALFRKPSGVQVPRYKQTIDSKPWKDCSCAVCQKWGPEVVIFRGNDRNRRRGFHNTFVFYRLLQDVLNTEREATVEEVASGKQLGLFSSSGL